MNHVNIFFILFLSFCFTQIGIAQIRFFTNDELPSEHIYQITQDNSGYIWFLTEEGMVKYDGSNLKTFTVADGLPTNAIWNSVITDNRIWYLCKGAEQGYIENDSIHNFKLDHGTFMPHDFQVKGKEVYLSAVYEHLYKAKNGKWLIKNKAHFPYNDSLSFRNINLPNISHSVANYKTIDFYNKEKLLLSIPISYLQISTLKVYSDSLIVFSLDKEVFFINANTLEYTKATIPLAEEEVLYATSVRLINGEFQVSYKNFVGILDENYYFKESYHIDPKYNAHANLIDKDGNIWLGSFTTGIHFISEEEHYSKTKNATHNTYSPIWFEDDIYYVTNGNIETFNSNETIIQSDGHIYLSGLLNDKLYYYLDKQKKLFELKDKKKKYIPIYLNGKASGFAPLKILRLNGKYITRGFFQIQVFDENYENKRNYPFTSSNIFLVYDSILIASNNGLFYINEKDEIKPTAIKEAITSIVEYDNGLIIGTIGKGLLFYKNNKTNYLSLGGSSVNSIKKYKDKVLLCATNQGVFCLKKEANTFKPYYRYTKKDGLLSLKTNGLAIDDDNQIYITTKKGITKAPLVLPSDLKPKLKEIKINKIIWGDDIVHTETDFELEHAIRKNLEIDFNSIYYSKAKDLQYAYKFEGEDNDFKPLSTGNLNLNGLSIGKHQLTLQTSIPFTENITKTISFEVKRMWFESLWFILGLILLGIGVIYFIIKKRQETVMNKRMQALEKEAVVSNFKLLALRSQMNPHFVFNSLNAIQYYITENQNDLSEKYLLNFAKLVRQFFDLSEMSSIDLKTEIDLLTNYLDLEKMRFEEKLDFKIDIDPKLDLNKVKIPTMLVQPIVENAVNHGIFHKEHSGTVLIKFIYISATEYQVKIEDDGIGVKNSKILKAKSIRGHQSKSTFIIHERITLLNNTKEWEINYRTSNLRNEEKYPGTIVQINLKYIDESHIN